MTRWKEMDGQYVDLDEVRAIEPLSNEGGGARLSVPGGSILVRFNVVGTTELPYPAYPQYDPGPRPPRRRWYSRQSVRDAWADYCELQDNLRARESRDRIAYDAARDRSRAEQIAERFEALVCEIGAKDCEDSA